MTCAETLAPGIAYISKGIRTGEIYARAEFKNLCQKCPNGLTDAERKRYIRQLDGKVLCQLMCCCKNEPERSADGKDMKQQCVENTLKKADKALNYKSRYKAEISYNMTTDPPSPFMHRANGQDTTEPSRYWQGRAKSDIESFRGGRGYVRRPDVVIVDDPTKPPYQENIHHIMEMKFAGDRPGDGQYEDYRKIVGKRSKFKELTETECQCDSADDGDPVRNPIPIIAPQSTEETEGGLYDSPLFWGAATAVGAAATVALAVIPFDGPAGEISAGAATAAAASNFLAAF